MEIVVLEDSVIQDARHFLPSLFATEKPLRCVLVHSFFFLAEA